MAGRWDYGQETLTTLAKNTTNAGGDLGLLVRQLIQAAEPLAGKFNGAGKAAFDSFKERSDQISADLSAGLGSVNQGQVGMERAFAGGDQSMADEAATAMGSANFDAAKFKTGA